MKLSIKQKLLKQIMKLIEAAHKCEVNEIDSPTLSKGYMLDALGEDIDGMFELDKDFRERIRKAFYSVIDTWVDNAMGEELDAISLAYHIKPRRTSETNKDR